MRRHLAIADIIKTLKIEIAHKFKTDFDFFRFQTPHRTVISHHKRMKIRKQFRKNLRSFMKDYKRGLAEKT